MTRIWVVGVGAIGSVISCRLSSEPPCRLVDTWPEHVDAIRTSGLHVEFPDQQVDVSLPAFYLDQLDEIGEQPDLIFLAVKSTSTAEVLRGLLRHMSAETIVVSLQNGINEDLIASIVGRERTIGAVVGLGGALVAPGRARGYGIEAGVVVGELSGPPTARLEALAELIGTSVPVKVTDNIFGELWSKLVINTQLNAVCAVTGMTTDQVSRDPVLRRVSMSLAKETVTVALGLDLTLDASVIGGDPQAFLSDLDDEPMLRLTDGLTARYKDIATKPSMLQDLEKGRPTEIEALNGYVVSKGHELGLPVVANEAIVRLMRTTETAGRSLGREAVTAEFAAIV